MPGHEQFPSPMEFEEDYTDVIAFKTVFEMSNPVMSPHTGHIYDREDIMQWITQTGKDPIDRDKQLTASMLVPGIFVKQIAQASARKSARDEKRFQEIETRHQEDLRLMQASHKSDIDELRKLITGVAGQKTVLEQEKSALTQEVGRLNKMNEQLSKGYVNPVWNKFGSDIDKKLRKGSSADRTDALRTYATKVKTAVSDSELQEAVRAADSFREPRLAAPRRFGWFVKTSATSRAATEFQDKVCSDKGWEFTR